MPPLSGQKHSLYVERDIIAFHVQDVKETTICRITDNPLFDDLLQCKNLSHVQNHTIKRVTAKPNAREKI